jgi:hypothetical protein
MKITIENTTQITELVTAAGSVPARVWVGETDSGIKVHALITRIAASKTDDLSQFDKELRETRPPEPFDVFPLRMIL